MVYKCRIDGMVIELVDITDDWKGALVKHRYAGRDGADLEWLGWEPIGYRFKVVFSGAGTEDSEFTNSYASHAEFLQIVRQNDEVPLIHPVYGEIRGRFADLSMKHDDSIEFVQIEFTFVEQGLDKPVALKVSASEVIATNTKKVLGDLSNQFPPLTSDALAQPVPVDFDDPDWQDKFTSAFAGFSNSIQSKVAAVSQQLARIDAIGSAIGAASSSIAGAMEFAQNLPGQVCAKVYGLFDKVAELSNSLDGDRVRGSSTTADQLERQKSDFDGTDIQMIIIILASLQMMRSVSEALDADEAKLEAAKTYENAKAFDDNGKWLAKTISPSDMPSSPYQASRMVATARQMAADAMAVAIDPQPIAEMALALEESYRSRLLEYEQLEEIEVLDPTPLHLILLRRGQPYNMAERVARLNNLRNPSFVQGRLLVYAT